MAIEPEVEGDVAVGEKRDKVIDPRLGLSEVGGATDEVMEARVGGVGGFFNGDEGVVVVEIVDEFETIGAVMCGIFTSDSVL